MNIPIPILVCIAILLALAYWVSREETSSGGYGSFAVRPLVFLFVVFIMLAVMGGIYIW